MFMSYIILFSIDKSSINVSQILHVNWYKEISLLLILDRGKLYIGNINF